MITKEKISLARRMFWIVPTLFCGWNAVTAQERRYDWDQRLNCERNLQYQTAVINEASRKGEGSILIVLVRLGDGENSRELMRRRIYNIRRFIEQNGSLKPGEFLIAEGERVNGYGRVEYYIKGRLDERLLFPKNGFVCHSCCGPDDSYYPRKSTLKSTHAQ